MMLQIFSVFDKKVNAYLQPFYCRTVGEAIRSFSEAVNDPQKSFGKHALDYVLMGHGEWDDAAGKFLCHDPVSVISAVEVLEDVVSPSPSKRMPM